MEIKSDYLIIGAGIYGLYAADLLAQKGKKIIILEYDKKAASRATYVNQARVHNGYHYPRSYSTAIKSSNYFAKFNNDFSFAINNTFKKVYAVSKQYSLTSGNQFKKFCNYADIKCEEVNPGRYFKDNRVDGTFITEEYAFDASKIRDYYVDKLKDYSNVEIIYEARISDIVKKNNEYHLIMKDNKTYVSPFVLNATYASVNQIIDKLNYEMFNIKYELCEIILCETSNNIEDIGITVMDGPFFSVMPFGLNGIHSLTSVTFTPHSTSYDDLPTFECQNNIDNCSPKQLNNCNNCPESPGTAWDYMYSLARKYLNDDIELKYKDSLFSIKPILMQSELDDSRPTVIKKFNDDPTFISVLSGKINTIYDLKEVLI
ncbi:FAD dependent oxidoreductase [Halanaerobium congolense]|uniref:FAD dependent oxidoreductase n=1 Tax=Halanaerobium congolense TaxID=54121 RepID=A0A1G8R1L3_9FIRM|nr:FAD-dependent oxidoreductase [Halanaerobium congolense]SDJ10753.1 FAD dependent oxidoreductase [Halanaerobium congolense]SET65708.1 FAD dependent oxidoreductase [Halanaerobium congolense]